MFISEVLSFLILSSLVSPIVSRSHGLPGSPPKEKRPILFDKDIRKKLQKDVYSAMNLSVDPCEDFSEYSCGNWARAHRKPRNWHVHKQWDTFALWTKNFHSHIKALLDEEPHRGEPAARNWARNFFKSCLTKGIEQPEEIKTLKALFKDVYGWSEFHERDFSPHQWTVGEAAYTFHVKYGMDIFFTSQITSYYESHFLRLTNVKTFNLVDMTFANGMNVLGRLFVEILKAISLNGEVSERAGSLINDVLDLENKIYELAKSDIQSDPAYLNLPDAHGEELFWDLFKTAFENLPAGTRIVIENPAKFRLLWNHLSKLEETLDGKIVLASFVGFRVIAHLMRGLSNKYDEIFTTLSSTYPIESYCMEETLKYFNAPLTSWSHERYNQSSERALTLQIFEYVRSAERIMIQESWMDNNSKDLFIRKLDRVYPDIGIERLRNYDARSFEIFPLFINPRGSFVNNLLAMMQLKSTLAYERLGQIRRYPFDSQLGIVNGQYILTENRMVIHPCLLEETFFSLKYPFAVNFGKLGYVIGHELTHSFDRDGSLYNESGPMTSENSNWREDTLNKLNRWKRHLVDQYQRLSDDYQKVHGENTFDENLADIVGLRAAYWAYRNWSRVNIDYGPLSERDELTHNQLLFVSAAQTYCTGKTEQDLIFNTPFHTPHTKRIIGMMTNTPEFAATFKCRCGSNHWPRIKNPLFTHDLREGMNISTYED